LHLNYTALRLLALPTLGSYEAPKCKFNHTMRCATPSFLNIH
jgi:hypothetical protein